jgi:hypothetical protein
MLQGQLPTEVSTFSVLFLKKINFLMIQTCKEILSNEFKPGNKSCWHILERVLENKNLLTHFEVQYKPINLRSGTKDNCFCLDIDIRNQIQVIYATRVGFVLASKVFRNS